ncbi:MAG: PEGA domain-containing protein [Deltaproteobacteria bacterium]|nr:PEGA domain-containing protein [Deltaproteobacteria bacterium]
MRCAIVLIASLTAASAVAQTPRNLLTAGNKLFAAGKYAKAFETYEKGYKKAPKNPVFLRSMALCKLKLFAHKAAQGYYREYLKRYPKAQDLEKVNAALEELAVIVGTRLQIDSTPSGAEVFLDAEALGARGKTPALLTIKPGRHTVILRAPGYRATSVDFELQAEQTKTLTVTLEAPVRVETSPSGAQIVLAGKALGESPREIGLPPGTHTLVLRKPGYPDQRRTLTVATPGAGRTPARLKTTLTLAVDISSTPPGATIEFGRRRSRRENAQPSMTPATIMLPAGQHTLSVKLPGFGEQTRRIDVRPGRSNQLAVLFQGGLLSMRTDPPGATVRVGDLTLGNTPISNAAVPLGQQPVEIKHVGAPDWSRALSFSSDRLVRANVRLGGKSWPVWTAAGIATASLAAGIITGLMAKARTDDMNGRERWTESSPGSGQIDLRNTGWCGSDGTALTGFTDSTGSAAISPNCSRSLHHASSTTFIFAGVAGVYSLVHYLLFTRPKAEISVEPADRRTAAR